MQQRPVRSNALWMILATALCTAAACASSHIVDHAFSFDTRAEGQDAIVLDYRYGDSKLPVRANEEGVGSGRGVAATNVHGPMLRGDLLYVKWRLENTGKIYEDTVDLRQRLPPDIKDHRIHFMIKGPQLYVYLISPNRRPLNVPPNGPEMYRHRLVMTIYPDQRKP